MAVIIIIGDHFMGLKNINISEMVALMYEAHCGYQSKFNIYFKICKNISNSKEKEVK